MILSAVATLMARTGLVFLGMGMAYLLVGTGKIGIKASLKAIGYLAVIVIIALIAVRIFNLDDMLLGLFWRLVDLFERGFYNSFFRKYIGDVDNATAVLPPLSWETLLGTGITSGTSGNGIYVNIDGGFARLYVALGLPMACIFYLCMSYNMYLPIKRTQGFNYKLFLICMAVYILVIGEFKEYFIYESYAVAIYLVIIMLKEKQNIH